MTQGKLYGGAAEVTVYGAEDFQIGATLNRGWRGKKEICSLLSHSQRVIDFNPFPSRVNLTLFFWSPALFAIHQWEIITISIPVKGDHSFFLFLLINMVSGGGSPGVIL